RRVGNATQYLLQDTEYLTHITDPKKGTVKDVSVPRAAGQLIWKRRRLSGLKSLKETAHSQLPRPGIQKYGLVRRVGPTLRLRSVPRHFQMPRVTIRSME